MKRIALLVVFTLAACDQPAPPDAAANGTSVARDGFTLRSAAIALPSDDLQLPDRPGVAQVTAACTACHSPAMLLTQPALKPEQWAATVKKMREVYHAPVDPADEPAIIAYLTALTPPAATAAPPASPPPPTAAASSAPAIR